MWGFSQFQRFRGGSRPPPSPAQSDPKGEQENPEPEQQEQQEQQQNEAANEELRALAQQGRTPTQEESRQMLLDMGFDGTQVDTALRECGGVASEAALFLLSMPPDVGNGGAPAGAEGRTELLGVDAAAALADDDETDATLREVLRLSQEITSADEELERALRLSEETLREDESRRRAKPREYQVDATELSLQEGMQQLRERAAASSHASPSSRPTSDTAGAAKSSSSSTSQPHPASPSTSSPEPRPASRRLAPSVVSDVDAILANRGGEETLGTSPNGASGELRTPSKGAAGVGLGGAHSAADSVADRSGGSRGSHASGTGDLMRGPRSRSLAAMGFDVPSRPESVGSVGLDDLSTWTGEPESAAAGHAQLFGGGRDMQGRKGERSRSSSMAGLHAALTRAGVGARPGSGAGLTSVPSFGGMMCPPESPQKRSAVAPLIPINQAVGLTPNGALIASGQRPMIRSPHRQRPGSNSGSRRPMGGAMNASSSTSLLAAASAALSTNSPPR